MSRSIMKLLACCAVPLMGLAGCAELDPATRDGMWAPTGANATNLRAMVAVPGDLVVGRAARTSDGNRAARAVTRLRTDRVYPLPDITTSTVGGGGGSASPPAAGPETQ